MGKALLLSAKQAAAAIGVSERSIHKWILAEKIGHRIGPDGRKKIPLAQLKKHLDTALYETIKLNLENGLDPMALPEKAKKKPAAKKPATKAKTAAKKPTAKKGAKK